MINLINITDLDKLEVEVKDIEQLGTKEKFWFFHPKLQIDCLFKRSRDSTGEHWSEVIASDICSLLRIPHARYELAYKILDNNCHLGVFTDNVLPDSFELIIGNQFLYKYVTEKLNRDYPIPLATGQRVKEHTVDSVLNSLKSIELKDNKSHPNLNACDMFCGYLLLDAIISNQDRHHENWAILQDNNSDKKYLCPTYDHASGLGSNILEKEKKERLTTNDKQRHVYNFVKRARSELYQSPHDDKPLKTIDAFLLATSHENTSKNIQDYWKKTLSTCLNSQNIKKLFEKFDDNVISETSKQFAIQIIEENTNRILGR